MKAPGELSGADFHSGQASKRSSETAGNMSGCRQQQPGGASGSVPGTSSGSSVNANIVNNGGSSANANANGNGVSLRSLGSGSETQLLGAQRPSLSGSNYSKKRPLYNGLINPYEDKSNDFVW